MKFQLECCYKIRHRFEKERLARRQISSVRKKERKKESRGDAKRKGRKKEGWSET